MKTTFEKIKEFNPCPDGWRKLIECHSPSCLSEEISVKEILESNGIKDAVWSLRCVDDQDSVLLFCADVAGSVLPIFEAKHEEDKRPRLAIEAIRKYVRKEINKDELINATDAAYTAAYTTADAAANAAADAAANAADAAANAVADAAANAAYIAGKNKWDEIEILLLKYI
ncbi:MAG: hypothetical protein GY775_16920 [Candidatus Scalindua sp.]|nr:hypothetical protein [Candidatus Scalindua sp.]